MTFPWLLRGLVMTAVHVGVRVLLGVAIIGSPLHSTAWKTIAVAAVVLVALLWGGIDGIFDARANSDPDDYADLTVRWLKAGVFAGAVSSVVSWLLGTFVFSGMGQATFFIELFAGGSFTALLIFVPAFIGAAVGRWLIRLEQKRKTPDTSDWSVHPDAQQTEQIERV